MNIQGRKGVILALFKADDIIAHRLAPVYNNISFTNFSQ